MGRAKIFLSQSVLRKLYLKKKWPPERIGRHFRCSFATIRNRLREYQIPFRNPAEARIRYKKIPFNGSVFEKSYLCGFAWGDLNVYRPSENGVTLVVRCHTTQIDQVRVMKECFGAYGHVTVSKSSHGFHVNVYLDADSFSFLIKQYEMPRWIKGKAGWAFIAGYNDAEGNFILNQKRGRMKIDSYDYWILRWCHQFLNAQGIMAKLRKIALAGEKQNATMRYQHDLWRLNVNEAHALYKTIKNLLPYTRHKKRKRDMLMCMTNITKRKLRGTI